MDKFKLSQGTRPNDESKVFRIYYGITVEIIESLLPWLVLVGLHNCLKLGAMDYKLKLLDYKKVIIVGL